MKVSAIHTLVFVIQRLFAILFRLADKSLNVFLPVPIATLNFLASSCFINSKVSLELSSFPAKLCNARFTTASRSRIDEPKTFEIASPLCTSSVASLNHYYFQNLSPKTIHILCKIKHVATKSDTFFKWTSICFKRIRHLSLSILNVRSTHMRIELCTKFQWYSSLDGPSLWPLNEANIHGRYGYATSPTNQ